MMRWRHTSSVLAMIANVNRDPKKSNAFEPADFDPHHAKGESGNAVKVTKENMAEFRDAFKGTRK